MLTGYRWIHCMKTKDKAIKVFKRWYSDITDLRAKPKLLVLMSDNASVYKTIINLNKWYQKESGVTSVHRKNNGYMPVEHLNQQSIIINNSIIMLATSSSKDSDGKIRTWGSLLIQGSYGRQRFQKCGLQGAHRDDVISRDVLIISNASMPPSEQ